MGCQPHLPRALTHQTDLDKSIDPMINHQLSYLYTFSLYYSYSPGEARLAINRFPTRCIRNYHLERVLEPVRPTQLHVVLVHLHVTGLRAGELARSPYFVLKGVCVRKYNIVVFADRIG